MMHNSLALALRLALLLALVAYALGVPTAMGQRSIDEPLNAAATYRRNSAADNIAHTPGERDTNASRLRRGFPPIPPRGLVAARHHKSSSKAKSSDKGKGKDKNKHYDKSSTTITTTTTTIHSAPSASASAANKRSTGVIAVVHNSRTIGMVSRDPVSSDVQRFGLTDNRSDAMVVSMRSPSAVFPRSLEIEDADSGFVQLGFVTGPASQSDLLAESTDSHAVLSATDHTAGGSTPRNIDAAYGSGLVQSGVWTLDLWDNALTPRWINADGSEAPTKVMYLPREDALLVTGNENLIKRHFDVDAVVVELRLA